MRHKLLIFVLIALFNSANLKKLTTEQEDELILSKARCSTLSCVHSSALILQKVNLDTKPCDDFFNFACGSYLAEQHTPDEKATVDTLRFMYEQLIEYLLRLFEHPSESTTSQKIHKYAQNFFDGCMNTRE
jgi:membrane metallo-endopeptidase-like protein 1